MVFNLRTFDLRLNSLGHRLFLPSRSRGGIWGAALILILSLFGTQAMAQDGAADMTSLLQNPSFEWDNTAALSAVDNNNDGLRGYAVSAPQGWTVDNSIGAVSLIVTSECFTDNDFGKVTTLADGSQAYYQRLGWTTGTSQLSQTIAAVDKGKYRLSMACRTGYANQATSGFTLFAGKDEKSGSFAAGSKGCFATQPWTTSELLFEQKTSGTLTVGVKMTWASGGSCIMVDDFRLERLPDDTVIPTEGTESSVESPVEGVVDNTFVDEATMKDDLLQMLATFATYMKNDFQDCAAPNSIGEACGCFRGENTMGNNEQGVRPNADLSMVCAFLVKYGKDKVTLPAGVTWTDLEQMAMKSLVFAYSTHKANKLKVCSGGNYWGSLSKADAVWESSLWAMSVAYSAFFQWDGLSQQQRQYIYQMLKAECNYELERDIPTGYAGDTKAEENGWEADILAATLGLFPDDELAPRWFDRLRRFAINSYSQKAR